MDGFFGEIRLFAFNYPPEYWAYCNGVNFSIQQNPALFAVIGSTFGVPTSNLGVLPNLQSRAAVGYGAGPNLTPYSMGTDSGVESVSLTTFSIAPHSHTVTVQSTPTASDRIGTPVANVGLGIPAMVHSPKPTNLAAYAETSNSTCFPPGTIGAYGGSSPHENRQPVLAMNFCICTNGTFLPRP